MSLHRSIALLALAVLACTKGDDTAVDTGTPEDSLAFETGEVFIPLALDGAGCTAIGGSASTSTGVSLEVEPGTCFQVADGRRLLGDIVVGIDSSPDFASAADASLGPADGGHIGVIVATMPDDTLVDAVFEPSLRVRLPDIGELDGSRQITTWVPDPDGRRDHLELQIVGYQRAATGPIGDDSRVDKEFLVPCWGLVRVEHDGPPPPPPAMPGVLIYERDLGPVGEVWPAVKTLSVATKHTWQIVRIDNFTPAMSTPGQSRYLDTPRDQGKMAVRVIERDGRRVFQLWSEHKNKLRLAVGVKGSTSIDDFETERVDSTGFSEDEADTDASYLGAIAVEIHGKLKWPEMREKVRMVEQAAIDTQPGGTHPWEVPDATFDRRTTEDGTSANYFRIHDYTTSVQVLRAALPDDWEVTYDDRRLIIKLPCPPPNIATVTETGGVSAVDPTTWQPAALGNLTKTPDAAIVAGDVLWGGTQDTLESMDLFSGIKASTALPGFDGALAVGPDGKVFAVLEDDQATPPVGHLVAYEIVGDPPILDVVLPFAGATHVAVTGDGAQAYVGHPTGLVYVDLVRETVSPEVEIGELIGLATSSTGEFVAVLDGLPSQANAEVLVVDTFSGTEGTFDVSQQASDITFTADDSAVLVAEPGFGVVVQIDPVSLQAQSVVGNGQVSCVTSYLDDDGLTVLGCVPDQQTLLHYTFAGATTAPTDAANATGHGQLKFVVTGR